MELTLDQALQKGIEAHKAGQVKEADKYYTAIIQARPKHSDANHNMGVLAVGVGKVKEALPFFKIALESNPITAQHWLSYIDALIKLNRIVDAKAAFDQAKEKGARGDRFDKLERELSVPSQTPPETGFYNEVKAVSPPNVLDNLKLDKAHKLARIKLKAGAFEEAKRIYQDILCKFPKNKKAINGIKTLSGIANGKATKVQEPAQDQLQLISNLYSQGKLQQSLDEVSQLLQQFPNSALLYNIRGAANAGLGKVESAIEAYSKVLSLKPDYSAALYNMGNTLQGVVFSEPNPDLQGVIKTILDHKTYVRPIDISGAAISLLKFEPSIRNLFRKHAAKELRQSIHKVVLGLSEVPLLLKLMSICPIADLELEDVLTNVRCGLLLSESESAQTLGVLRFQSALALQCHTNDYIYQTSDREARTICALETSVKSTLSNGEQPNPQSILCLASYKALHQYEWSKMLIRTNAIEEVFTRQVLELDKELRLHPNIPALQEITNEVSLKVRGQYEENPYPRWIGLRLPLEPAPISRIVQEVRLKLFDRKINDIQVPNILIAGCGTGQHSLGTTARFKNSKVLAVDLSLSSLGYAKRKTEELGIQNIEYMQADILDLCKLERQFDIIESSGVLHHMNDPMKGWKVLTDCLKPCGLMKVGLYSELGRKHIVEMREEINQSGIGSSDLAMKLLRRDIIGSDKENHKKIKNFNDFYSLSELRDLLFHVQEHRFTIPQIKDCLFELGLKFCGFEAKHIVQEFQLANAGADDLYDLNKWHLFEQTNPNIFSGMYQMWCQKV